MTEITPQLKVLHIISGDRWAGAEVQAYTLLSSLQQSVDLTVVLMNEGTLSKSLQGRGIKTVVLDESIHNSVWIFFKLVGLVASLDPDLIHTHRAKENILGSFANLFSVRAISLRTVHGAPEYQPRGLGRIIDYLDVFSGKYLQRALIAVSQDLAGKLAKSYVADRISTIVNGVDDEAINVGLAVPDFKLNNPSGVHIGIVGRLDPVKRIDIFIQMAAQLLSERADIQWHFHIFGEGAELQELQSEVEELGVAPSFVFHGHRDDINNCIAALTAVVMCSDHEGLPMTALETLALGTPMIAHRVGGLIDVLAETPDRLVEDHSPEGYKSALLKLLDGPIDELKLARKFTAAQNATEVLRLYQKLYVASD